MMSLFSPFDLGIFYGGFTLSFALISMGLLVFSYKNSLLSKAIFLFSSFLSSFFSSLNKSNYTKMMEAFLVSSLILLFFMNFVSIFSYIFPATSQVSLILYLACSFWMLTFIPTFFNLTKKFFSHLVPEGSPLGLSIFLFVIELVSSLIRPVTLMVRLVANILAGHLLVILLSGLVLIFPPVFPFLSTLNFIELFVSLIQAYIFFTLVSLYYSEM